MKIIAYYLPQFHEIPENNKWWGNGFTEWDNVKNGQPLFQGHYQPRIPLNNNYYNLLSRDTKQWQISLAKRYGIYGFCIYHYWFNGKLLLEKPAEQILNDKELDINFCFSWANEYWTNGWVSDKNNILMSHNNSDPNDWVNHFNYFLPYFKDQRYIKINGKPLITIYFPTILERLDEMIKCWRKLAKENGFDDLFILYQHPLAHFNPKLNKKLFDAGIEFQPQFCEMQKLSSLRRLIGRMKFTLINILKRKLKINFIRRIQTQVVHRDYNQAWSIIVKSKPKTEMMFPGAFVDWDNTARKGVRGSVYDGANPLNFKKYFKQQIENAASNYGKDMLFVFAWNEWGESGYLEPDEKYGYAYLEAIKEALIETKEMPK